MPMPPADSNKSKASLLQQWRNKKKQRPKSLALGPQPAGLPKQPSSGQQRLWLLQQLYPNNAFYQYAHFYEIKGDLNLELLEQSFQRLIDRQEILRTNFVERAGELGLEIAEEVVFKCQVVDLRGEGEAAQRERAAEVVKEESIRLFDLEREVLLRACVIRFSESHHQMVVSMPHIIGDRWSLQLLNQELFNTYKALLQGESPTLPPLPIQYSDYAYWQRQQKVKPSDESYPHLK